MEGCETDRPAACVAFAPNRKGSPRHQANRGAGKGAPLIPALVEGEVTGLRRTDSGPDTALHVMHHMDGGHSGGEFSGGRPHD